MKYLALLSFFLLTLNGYGRPHWTEKTSFLQGTRLYVVGVASNAYSKREGRIIASEHAVEELRTYLGVIERPALALHTQMTYEEASGLSWDVYRLMYVESSKLDTYREKVVEAERIHRQAQRRIEFEQEASSKLRCGMNIYESVDIAGNPQAVDRRFQVMKNICINYGEKWFAFYNGILRCEIPNDSYSGCLCAASACPKN